MLRYCFLFNKKTGKLPVIKYFYTKKTGNDLCFQEGNLQVFSALKSLTSVFGMGTGVSSSLSSPENYLLPYYTTFLPSCQYFLSSFFPTHHTQKYTDKSFSLLLVIKPSIY